MDCGRESQLQKNVVFQISKGLINIVVTLKMMISHPFLATSIASFGGICVL